MAHRYVYAVGGTWRGERPGSQDSGQKGRQCVLHPVAAVPGSAAAVPLSLAFPSSLPSTPVHADDPAISEHILLPPLSSL